MKKYSRKLNRIELLAKAVFNSILILHLFSCTKKTIQNKPSNAPFPLHLEFERSIELGFEQFLPEKITTDVKGNTYIVGNRRRLIVIKHNGVVGEINIETIYPCEITNIGTDGFDIFLLDRMNNKIWTVTREVIGKKGFSLGAQPLLFAVSKKRFFAILYYNKSELTLYSRNEKVAGGVALELDLQDRESGTLLFQNNILYFASRENDEVSMYFLYNPSQTSKIVIQSPTSLALDNWQNLFIASSKGIQCMRNGIIKKDLLLQESQGTELSLFKDRLILLNPNNKRIDVYKIVYSSADPNTP